MFCYWPHDSNRLRGRIHDSVDCDQEVRLLSSALFLDRLQQCLADVTLYHLAKCVRNCNPVSLEVNKKTCLNGERGQVVNEAGLWKKGDDGIRKNKLMSRVELLPGKNIR